MKKILLLPIFISCGLSFGADWHTMSKYTKLEILQKNIEDASSFEEAAKEASNFLRIYPKKEEYDSLKDIVLKLLVQKIGSKEEAQKLASTLVKRGKATPLEIKALSQAGATEIETMIKNKREEELRSWREWAEFTKGDPNYWDNYKPKTTTRPNYVMEDGRVVQKGTNEIIKLHY